MQLLKKANKDYKQTIIMITHNLEIAKLADRIIKIEDGNVVNDLTRINEEKVKKIASNVLEVSNSHIINKEDLKRIYNENSKYIGLTTNLHDLTLAYDEILDYKSESNEEFIQTKEICKKEENLFDGRRSKLSIKDASKMARDNLKHNNRKYRFLNNVFSCFGVFLIISLIFSFLSINTFIAKQTTNKKFLNYIQLSKEVSKIKSDETNNINNLINKNNLTFLNNYKLTPFYSDNISNLQYVSDSFNGIIETDDIKKLDLNLKTGKQNFNDYYEIIISDYMAYNFSKYGILVENNNNLEVIHPKNTDELLNKNIRIKETGKNYKIIGIYETNFKELFAKYSRGNEDSEKLLSQNINFLYSKIITKIGFYKQYKEDYKDYSFYEENDVYVAKLKVSNNTNNFYFNDTRLKLNKNKIDKNVTLFDLNGKEINIPDSLKNNEIIISLDNVLNMFGEENMSVTDLLSNNDISKFLKDENLKLSLYQNNNYSNTDSNDERILENYSIKIIGILDTNSRVFVSDEIYDYLEEYLEGYDSVIYYNQDNTLELTNKINKLTDNKYIVNSSTTNIETIKILSEVINALSDVFTILTIVLLIISFLVCLNYMNIIVKNRYKEFTIYRTLGAKKKDIYVILLFESLYISLKSMIVGIIGSYLLTFILNNILSSISMINISGVKILNYNILYCLVAFACIFLISLLASYISVKDLLKKKLVNAFKES